MPYPENSENTESAAQLHLTKPSQAHLIELRSWFKNQDELLTWGGPGISFPTEQGKFESELNLESLASFVLLNHESVMIGFGQFYQRLTHCHLGRLAIAPNQRGKGHIYTLVGLLQKAGQKQLGINSNSLFVMQDNHIAIKAYQKLGFEQRLYPEDSPMEGCFYMVKNS